MSKIDTIENISDRLTETVISIIPKRCSYIRNWHSSCKRCINACKHDAVVRSVGHLNIDSNACTNCGACAAACPTSALIAGTPTPASIVRDAKASASACGGNAIFICSRAAELSHVDTSRVVVLPCLNYLDEYMLMGLFSVGVSSVTLMQTNCSDCDIDSDEPYFPSTVEHANFLLEQWQIPGRIFIRDFVPKALLANTNKRQIAVSGEGRREAFKQAGGSVMGFLMDTVGEFVNQHGGDIPVEDKNARVIVRIDEHFDASSYRTAHVESMLNRLGTTPDTGVESYLWGTVDIDPEKCRHCGACAGMCATQALVYENVHENRGEGDATLIFRPSLCMGCRLCKDSCVTHSLVFSNKVNPSEVSADAVKVLFEHEMPLNGAGKPIKRW